VVIDTEEQFDWYGDFDREATDVSAILEFHPLQAIFEEFGIRPVFVMDYPMATTPCSIDYLGPLQAAGRAELGVHLHTWVNPPFDEEVNRPNSYQGNLPEALERRKLEELHAAFRNAFGFEPRVHKAGRYGLGVNTASILHALGIEVDLSVAPAFDYSADGGPDYARAPHTPRWLTDRVLGIPTSGGFVGPLLALGPRLHSARAYRSPAARNFARVLSRTRALERIMLSPEGHSLAKLERLTLALIERGERLMTFSFHSSSVRPGATAYVANEEALKVFTRRCRQYFEFFFGTLGGRSMTATEARSRLGQIAGSPAA